MQTFSRYTTDLEYSKTLSVMKIKKRYRITTCRAFTLLGSWIKNRGYLFN